MKNKTLAIRMTAAAVGIMMLAGICAGQSYWKRTYRGTGDNCANAITPTPDGNFIIAGYTTSFGAGNKDVYLLKIKPNGDTIWTKTYGGTLDGGANAIIQTKDGNFIVAGYTSSFGMGGEDVYLLKINSDGDTIWTKTYGGPVDDTAHTIAPTLDGNFIVAGSYGGIVRSVYLLKIKPNGDTIWTKSYNIGICDAGFAITPTTDGGFIIVGTSEIPSDYYNFHICLLKINSNGDTLLTKTYGYSEAHAIIPSTDGNFLAVGHEGANINLLKIKPSGDTLWTTRYSAKVSDGSSAITPTTDNNFIVTGWRDSIVKYIPGMGFVYHWDAYLLKIKPDGDTLWTKTYGDTDNSWAFAITPTPDGNFIVAGYTQSSAGDQKVFLFSLIDDRYAYKNTPFFFKIPISGDSLSHGYTPLKVPTGMTVSLGGTISWTPTTDSSYMDHVEFLVSDDVGKKDTLTFNIFVNSKDHPSKAINPTSGLKNQAYQSGISISTFSSYTSFSLPVPTGSLAIYDIHGRLVQNLSIINNSAVWQPKNATGRYVARMMLGKSNVSKAFVVVK